MTYNGLSGGFRLLGDSLNGGLRTRDGFVVTLEPEFTWVLVKVKGLRGAGALREPMDSNSSFPVILTPSIVFATVETLRHMLDNGSRLSGTATSGLEGRVPQLQIKLLTQLKKAFCFLLFWILSRLFP